MKRLLPFVLVACVLGDTVSAQVSQGVLGLYADPGGAQCGTTAAGEQVVVYVIHHMTPGSKGCRFAIQPDPDGYPPAPNVSYSSEFLMLLGATKTGRADTGVEVYYGGCPAGPILLMWVVYDVLGASLECSSMRPVAYPGDPTGCAVSIDCDDLAHPIGGGWFWFNVNSTCGDCPVVPPTCIPVPVEDHTWGQIKSLYE